jgi:hypothetical protein
MRLIFTREGRQLEKRASIAGSRSRLRIGSGQRGSVPVNAYHIQELPVVLTTLRGSVLSAVKHSLSTNTPKNDVAAVRVVCVERVCGDPQPVYNVATSDGTFFVNGVLVHNCDSLRYLLMSVAANKGVQPTSTRSSDPGQHRPEVQLVRPGNGRIRLAPAQAATAGFFRR